MSDLAERLKQRAQAARQEPDPKLPAQGPQDDDYGPPPVVAPQAAEGKRRVRAPTAPAVPAEKPKRAARKPASPTKTVKTHIPPGERTPASAPTSVRAGHELPHIGADVNGLPNIPTALNPILSGAQGAAFIDELMIAEGDIPVQMNIRTRKRVYLQAKREARQLGLTLHNYLNLILEVGLGQTLQDYPLKAIRHVEDRVERHERVTKSLTPKE